MESNTTYPTLDNPIFEFSTNSTVDPWEPRNSYSVGEIVTIIIVISIIITAFVLSLTPGLKEWKKVNSGGKYSHYVRHKTKHYFKDLATFYSEHYHEIFEACLIRSKGGLILGFILITIIYQKVYGAVPAAKTYLGSNQYWWRAFVDMLNTALFGIISTAIILQSRGNLRKGLPTLVIVGMLLGSFNLAMESSGFNRFLAKKDIEECIGPYANIYKEYCDAGFEFTQVEEGGDPFIKCLAYTTSALVGLSLFYLLCGMLISTYFGYQEECNSISNCKIFNRTGTPKLFWFEAIGIAGFLNTIPPLMGPWIRDEEITDKSYFVAFVIFVIGVVLQFMFQYTGMLSYKESTDSDDDGHKESTDSDNEGHKLTNTTNTSDIEVHAISMNDSKQ